VFTVELPGGRIVRRRRGRLLLELRRPARPDARTE
jgi:hypothetical protein